MIVDLVKKVHTSDKYQKMVSDYLLSRDKDYMQSKCRLRLEKRYRWLKASLEGAYSPSKNSGFNTNSWLPTLIFPMVREMYYMIRGMTKKNFRQDPLITLEPMGITPYGNALNAQVALNTNFKSTLFRSKCFEGIVDDVSRFGCAISASSIMSNTTSRRKTVDTPFGPYQQMVSQSGRTNVINTKVHILNYAQNEFISDPEESDWKRVIESIPLSKLMAKYKINPDMYVKKGIEGVLKAAKKEVINDTDKWHDDNSSIDLAKSGIDVKTFYSKMWIAGNEDDERDYIIQMVEDKVISFEENGYDDAICPLQVYRLRRTSEYFWGNSPAEDVMPHEKFTHILMNMKAQNTLQSMERYIFYMDDTLSPGDLFNRHKNGGFVKVKQQGSLQIQNMIHEYQGTDSSTNEVEYMMRQINESKQGLAFKPDFLRSGNKGGLANNTATAATILDETSNVLEADSMEVIGYDVSRLGKINTILLQMFLGDLVRLPINPKQTPETIMKSYLLGDFSYNVVSSIHKNKVQEAIRLQNVVTQLVNFKATGLPEFQNIDILKIAKNWIRKIDVGDPDEIVPEQPQAATGMQNQLPLPQPQAAPAQPGEEVAYA